jgi:hypothetical protein
VTSVLHRHTSGTTRQAGPLEEWAARAWNVLNEGKPFTVVFAAFLLLVTGAPARGWAAYALFGLAFWRHAYPLHLRAVLWAVAAAVIAAAGGLPARPAALALALYLTFTVVLWGTVYYHLRLGARWTNFTRFWKLVLENPDPTSGNFLEQVPKIAVALAVGHSTRPMPLLLAAAAATFMVGTVVHRRFVTWVPGWATGARREDRRPRAAATPAGPAPCGPPSRKTLLLVIDGCRVDRLKEAHTPFLDRLAAEGISFERCSTVYPARTVTGFSSMLTGAPPAVHGMHSNFVPRLHVRCQSIFDVVPNSAMVGIAHLVDAFGDKVSTVTAVMPNDEIDAALCNRARQVVEEDDPDLLVVQTLSVDQTGHFRGSYYDEYLAHIESTDKELEALVGWLSERWGGLDGVTIGVLSDHGQGIGIGGHGHWTATERWVPCIWWGHAVPTQKPRDGVTIMDVAATLAHRAGVQPPQRSLGACLLCDDPKDDGPRATPGPVTVVLPVHNEAATLASVMERVPTGYDVVVVDDGSTDDSAAVAAQLGAFVVRHDRNRGLGAAVRTGFDEARRRGSSAVAFLDADGEYDPAELPAVLGPVLRGEADYVVGTRFGGTIESMLPWRRFGNRVLTLLTSALAGRRLSDAQSGMRALSAHALANADIAHDYNYAQVLTLSLLGKGFRYAEVPIRYRRRRQGRSFVRLGPYLRHVLPAMAKAARTR